METKVQHTIVKNDKRTINAWAMFDWANSAYALVITAAIFPIYFNSVIDDEFLLFGISFTDSSIFSYSISLAYLMIAAVLPLLTGIADYSGKRLLFMRLFTIMGSLACMILFFFEGMSQLGLALIGFMLAVIGFAGGQVFYNAFLPIITTEDRFDKVSAKGFAYGYIGSVILLIINLVMIQKPQWFGLQDAGIASRISFFMVGLWWIGFAQITFRRMPKDNQKSLSNKFFKQGYSEIRKVWKQVKKMQNIKRFLIAFFAYSAGVQTVIFLASTFATDELKFEASELIAVILILQLVGIGGAYLFAFVSKKLGNKISIIIMLIIWMAICIYAYFVTQKLEFYFIAVAVGMVMGGIQSISRSTYSKLIPENTTETASYFSFYDVLEKTAIVLGTFTFGFIDQIMGGMRNSVLALSAFFLIGIILMTRVKIKASSPA